MNRILVRIHELRQPRYVVYYRKSGTGTFTPHDMVYNGARQVSQVDKRVMNEKMAKAIVGEGMRESLEVRQFIHEHSRAKGYAWGTSFGSWRTMGVAGWHVLENKAVAAEYEHASMYERKARGQEQSNEEMEAELEVKTSYLKGLIPGTEKDVDKSQAKLRHKSRKQKHFAKVVGKFRFAVST